MPWRAPLMGLCGLCGAAVVTASGAPAAESALGAGEQHHLGQEPLQAVLLTLTAPGALARRHFAGLMSGGTAAPPAVSELTAFFPGPDGGGSRGGNLAPGCSQAEYAAAPAMEGAFAVFVDDHRCTASEKAASAKVAGAAVVVVVSADVSYPQPSDGRWVAPVVSVPAAVGEMLASVEMMEGASVDVARYDAPGAFCPAQCIIAALATALVVLGALFSTADLRSVSSVAPSWEEVVEVDGMFPVHFVVSWGVLLVALSSIKDRLTLLVAGLFCLSGAATLAELGHLLLRRHVVGLQTDAFSLPYFGAIEASLVLSAVGSGAVATGWLWYKSTEIGWLFQNILGSGLLCVLQRTLRLPNLKHATATLSTVLFFDVFWSLACSHYIHEGAMVEISDTVGGAIPLFLRVPAFGDPLSRDSVVGLGDIALPGLLVSYLRRQDVLSMRGLSDGYFLPSAAGYLAGTVAMMVAGGSTWHKLPAMLYLVPCTLGITLAFAAARGELGPLWAGIEGEPAGGEALIAEQYGQELASVEGLPQLAGGQRGRGASA